MSRAQQGQVLSTAQGENTTYNQNAQDAFTKAGQDINSYSAAVGKFQAANPYVQGGQAETAENQQTADTAAGMGESAGQAIQSAAVRTGQNPAGAIAATEKMQQQNERSLVGDQAKATESRLASDTGYQAAGLEGLSKVQGMQDTLAQQQAAAAQGALGTEEQAAQTPSLLDELGPGLITGGMQAASQAITKCWIAAELYGGWGDPRTIKVRKWLTVEFAAKRYGPPVLAAYTRWGARVAKAIQTHRVWRRFFQWLFNRALRAAEKAEAVSHGRG